MADPNMPADPNELASTTVELPRLDPDSPHACPVPMSDILEYLASEAYPDQIGEGDLQFLRTALVEGSKYWIWRFTESGGAECYVTVSHNKRAMTTGYAENYDGLTPEQFMLGRARGWL